MLLSFVTAPKLVKMLQIKEILPGSNYTEKTITGKWLEKSDSLKKDDAYWIAWDNADIEAVSGNRINLPEEEWNKYQTGNTIEITYFDGDTFPYHKDGLFTTIGNFIIDFVLLFLEILFFILFIIRGFENIKGKKDDIP